MTNRPEQSAELSPLKRALIALEQMQARLETAERAKRAPIAIIGMGCRFPGADTIQAFWQLLRNGVEAVGETPADRWDIEAYYDPNPDAPGKMSTRRGGFLDTIDQFDPQFFGIAPREALSMDPQQRLLLEVAWEALEHAAIAPNSLAGSRTGVYVGVTTSDYAQIQLNSAGLAGLDAYYASGVAHSIVSGRLSYILGLQGPSITLDTACSSSLVAVHMAVQSLRAGECRSALAGGVNLILSPENSITLSKYHMLAPDGRCKAFDASADGFVRGEGCGLVVLKRLSDALADGDRVLAVIRGSAVNQDGASSGLTAPNGPSQEAVIRDALANGGIAPHAVSYVEAHGTGTALGDPIEVQALAASLCAGRSADQPLFIGSLKTNMGHLEAAAGVAGLIKAVLMLQHAELPPHLHLHQPNPHIDWASMPITIPTVLATWPQYAGQRIAGVSSFGFSGTNAHLLLEEAPQTPASVPAATHGLVALSAKSEPALSALAARIARHLDAHPDLALADISATLNAGRAHFAHRIALAAETTAQLREQLAAYTAGQKPQGLTSGHVISADPPKIAFLFTGQGAQYPGMARTLYAAQPAFRAALDHCATLLQPLLDRPLLELIFDPADPNDRAHPIHQTAYTQPALFAVEYALTELWRSWGINPQAVLGHSVGEYVAAVLAGVFSLEDGLRLIVARGQLMQALPAGGAMAAIFAPVAAVQVAVAPYTAVLDVAAINGPEHTVIAGTADAVAIVSAEFVAAGVRVQPLTVSHAFHSPLMEPILLAFATLAAQVRYATPRLRLISNVSGKAAGPEISEPDYWVRHIRAAVRFADGITTLLQQGYTHFIEIGPHPTLLGMARLCAPPDTGNWFPSLRRSRDDLQQINESLAELYTTGVHIDWAAYLAPSAPQKIDLPTYPFQRQRYWVQARRQSTSSRTTPGEHPLIGRRLSSPLKTISFAGQIDTTSLAYLADHHVFASTILPATAFIEAALATAPTLGIAQPMLSDMVIHEPLVVADDETHALQTILNPGDGHTNFQIYSQAADASDWKLHASGKLAGREATAPAPDVLLNIQARCTNEVSAETHYALLADHGLAFGPSLRGIQRLWVGTGESLGEILLPAPQAAEIGLYHIHPALLDPCIQVIADLSTSDKDTYLPIGIERVNCYAQVGSHVWAHGRLHGDLAASPETLSADIRLYNASGELLAEIIGLVLKRASHAALLRMSGQERLNDWLYTPVWQLAPAAHTQTHAAIHIPATTTIAAQAAPQIARLQIEHEIERYQPMLIALETLSTDYIVLAIRRLGQPLRIGDRFAATDIRVLDRHRALLDRLLAILAEDGLLQSEGNRWRVLQERVLEPTEARWHALLEHYPAARGELTIARRCGESLAEALRGSADPLQLLFPGGSLEYAEQMYQESPFARFYNSLLGQAVAEAVAHLPREHRLRILEIGAGTGSTTSFVLPCLPAHQTEYIYTDISAHFLGKAREKFKSYPFLTYHTLDIEADLHAQGFGEQQFDIIVAANVLHATADLARTFANVRHMLAPGGLLVMLEMMRPQRFIDISFGLTEGWWKFVDHQLRPDYLLLGREQWLRFLTESGFRDAVALPESSSTLQAIVMARAPQSTVEQQTLPIDARTWLILADSSVGEQFAAKLQTHGGHAIIARPGQIFRQINRYTFELDPAQPADFARLLRESSAECSIDAIAHLWSLDSHAATCSAEGQALALGSALYLTQALAKSGATSRLWLVTRGAQPGPGEIPDVGQAPLWGFGKSVMLEHPELRLIKVDLDPSPTTDSAQDLLLAALANGEEDLMLRGGQQYLARLHRRKQPTPTAPVELAISMRGTLDNLVLRSVARQTPGPNEVEIRVHATGLNFKDVLNTLGMYPGDPGPLGGECAGVVVAVGAAVTDLHVGDAVVALAPGCFRSYVIAPATFVVPKPAGLSFAQAAGLLIANVTADFALNHLGHMRPGERVLIHAATGGVGSAAVGLAQQAGLEIFATAGSPEKRAYLASLGVPHIYDSRTLDFATQIQADTAGEGVDLVLNSLAGEFIDRSLSLLRQGGRFLEIGKRDHLSAAQADTLGRDLAYHVIDWGETALHDPQLIRSILCNFANAAAAGTLSPPPVRIFSLSDAQAAFRYMAQARHIGKVIVTQPDAAADTPAPMIHADASYLITGGLTGLGLLTARWLVEHGARHLVVMGRRAPNDIAQATIVELAQAGAHVAIVQGDVAQREDVVRALSAAATPPLRGIFHAAGSLDDGAISQQSWSRFVSVLAPKIDGAQLLTELTANLQLDYFVLYSSVASLFGSAGQANHAAANAFLDGLAYRRRAQGLAGVSINWGAWSDIGAAAERGVGERANQHGIGSIAPEQGLAVLEQLINQPDPQVGVTPIQWPVFLQRYAKSRVPSFFADMAGAQRSSDPVVLPTAQPDLLRRLEDAPPQRRRDILLSYVQSEAAYVLAMPAAQVDERMPLSNLGLDSLMAVELRNRLGASLARSLPATLVFDYPTITAITGYLADEALQLSPPPTSNELPAATNSDSTTMTNMLDELENLSDDEIDRLLAQRART